MFTRKLTLAVVLLLTVFFFSEAKAGPFGLEMGMSLKDIEGNPEKIGNGKYKLTNVPKPHSAFESYIVQVAPKSGLSWIKAIGKNISTSAYGTSLKSAFSEMEEKLENNYGDYKKMQFLMPGSIWDEPRDWMMALIKNERGHASVWNAEEGSTLPPDLDTVGLIASALSRDTGYLSIEYYFKNKEAAEAELAGQEDDAL